MRAQAKRCLAQEPGCLQFDVVEDPKAPSRFVMLEVYKDDDAIKAHQESRHFKDFRPVVGDLLADRKIEIFTMVSDGKTKRGGRLSRPRRARRKPAPGTAYAARLAGPHSYVATR